MLSTTQARLWTVDKPYLRVMSVVSAATGLAAVILVGVALARGASFGLPSIGILTALFIPVYSWLLWQTSRGYTSVDETGVRTRLGRQSETVTWDRVVGIIRHHGSRAFSLRLHDGSGLSLPGVQPSDFDEVNKIVETHLCVPRQDWP